MKKLILLALTLTALSAQAQNIGIVEAKVGQSSTLATAMNVDSFELEKLIVKHNGKLYNCIGTGGGIKCRKVEEAKK